MGKHVSVHSEILRAWGGSRGFGTTDVGVQGQGKRENTTAQGIAMSSRGSSIGVSQKHWVGGADIRAGIHHQELRPRVASTGHSSGPGP